MRTPVWRSWRPLVVLLLLACPAVCGLRAEQSRDQPSAETPALQRTFKVLRRLAAQTGQQPGGLLLITFANEAFQDLLINWVVHARSAGAHAFLVGAMDAGTHRFCSQHGLLSWPMDDEGLLDLIASSANTTELVKLADSNFRCALHRLVLVCCSKLRRSPVQGKPHCLSRHGCQESCLRLGAAGGASPVQ